MSKHAENRGAVAGALGTLSARERRLLALTGVALAVFVGSIGWSLMSSALRERTDSITEKETQLVQVGAFAGTYAETSKQRKELESRLAGAPLSLQSHLQELCDRHHVTIRRLKEGKATTTGELTESVVDLDGSSANLTELTALLNELERHPRIIKLKKLRVTASGTGDTRSLNVNLTAATYTLAGKQG